MVPATEILNKAGENKYFLINEIHLFVNLLFQIENIIGFPKVASSYCSFYLII